MQPDNPTPSDPSRPPADPSSSYHARKYGTGNPLVRLLIRRFLDHVLAEVAAIRPRRIVEIGCGEGQIAGELDSLGLEIEYAGYDLDAEAVEVAARRYPDKRFREADLFRLPQDETGADLVLCLEVLEHLTEPAEAVRTIARLAGRAAIFSVPFEPFFQLGSLLRGNYLSTWGNHPGHIQHFRPARFRQTVAVAFGEVRVRTALPWLIALAREPFP